MKNIRVFDLKLFNFLEMKVSIYLNRHVFVMIKRQDVQRKMSIHNFKRAWQSMLGKIRDIHVCTLKDDLLHLS